MVQEEENAGAAPIGPGDIAREGGRVGEVLALLHPGFRLRTARGFEWTALHSTPRAVGEAEAEKYRAERAAFVAARTES